MLKISLFPSPLSILLGVVLLASIGIWLIPIGLYNKLSMREKSFIVTTQKGEKVLAFNQKTLDSSHLNIAFQKFENGDIRKALSISGTYQIQPSKPQNLLKVLQVPFFYFETPKFKIHL